MSPPEALIRARQAFDARVWSEAYDLFREAESTVPLGGEDLDRVGLVAYLTGRDDESREALAAAHQAHLAAGRPLPAVRSAFWLALNLMLRGDVVPAGGWFARAARVVSETGEECVERGYLMVPQGIQTLFSGDPSGAIGVFDEALVVAAAFGDADLATLARHGRGQALLARGDTLDGMRELDEAMVAVTNEETSPLVTGIVYCAVIEACQASYDLQRAQQWTSALTRWCDAQPGLVPYRGQCLIHRAQIMQMHGAWNEALAEAERARDRLSDPPGQPAAGEAFYQLGEIHRLRGAFDDAERAYRSGVGFGRSPQPGLALLRLAEGRMGPAAASIRTALDEAAGTPGESRLLPAFVEIMLAAGDTLAARDAADRLAAAAATNGARLLRAYADQSAGTVALAEGDARGALGALRRALAAWLELDAPYDAARTRLLIGRACTALGDEDSARIEIDTARAEFGRLGARPDLARMDGGNGRGAPGGLTPREMQILSLVAEGRTNKAIASELVISEKTVARHISNIFTKLGVPSRAAATAYAYEHGIAGSSA